MVLSLQRLAFYDVTQRLLTFGKRRHFPQSALPVKFFSAAYFKNAKAHLYGKKNLQPRIVCSKGHEGLPTKDCCWDLWENVNLFSQSWTTKEVRHHWWNFPAKMTNSSVCPITDSVDPLTQLLSTLSEFLFSASQICG